MSASMPLAPVSAVLKIDSTDLNYRFIQPMSSKQVDHKLVVITAPSGAGKTSVARHLMQTFPTLSFSVSATTRAPRKNETEGKDYYFISREKFEDNIKANAFIEWEMVYEGLYYGTLKSEIESQWAAGSIPVLDIDVKGALNIKKLYPAQTLTLFIAPPSVEALRERLESRGTETAASIQKRLDRAAFELSFQDQFDQVILNERLEDACAQATKMVQEFLAEGIQKFSKEVQNK